MSEQIYLFSHHVSLYSVPSFSLRCSLFFFSFLACTGNLAAMLGSPEATQFPLSSRPSSPPSQHLSHSKIIARWCQWPRRHYRSQSREGRRGGCNACTRRGSGCQEGCDTCKSSPHFNPSQSSLRRHSFLYI